MGHEALLGNWKVVSSDPKVVKVYANGYIELLKPGTATIYLEYEGKCVEGSEIHFNVIEYVAPAGTIIDKNIVDLPLDMTQSFQLAGIVLSKVNTSWYTVLANGVYDNIGILLTETISQDDYDKEQYKKALLQVMANVPSVELTEKQQAELTVLKKTTSFLDGQKKVVAIVEKIAELSGCTDNANIKTITECINLFSTTLDSSSEIPDEAREILEAQFYAKLLYFEALKRNAGINDSLLDAINELQREYANEFAVQIKDFEQAIVDGAFDWGKEVGGDLLEIIIDQSPDAAQKKVLGSLSNVLKMVEVADFAMKYTGKSKGWDKDVEVSQESVALEAVQAVIAMSYLDIVHGLQTRIENGERLREEEYAYLIACYDLMRGCLITINKSAIKIADRRKLIEQLEAEIAQLERMSIDKWHLNEFFEDDLHSKPVVSTSSNALNALLNGSESSEHAGISAQWDNLNTEEHAVMREVIADINQFATNASANYDVYVIEGPYSKQLLLVNEEGEGLFLRHITSVENGAKNHISINVINKDEMDTFRRDIQSNAETARLRIKDSVSIDGNVFIVSDMMIGRSWEYEVDKIQSGKINSQQFEAILSTKPWLFSDQLSEIVKEAERSMEK